MGFEFPLSSLFVVCVDAWVFLADAAADKAQVRWGAADLLLLLLLLLF